MKPKDAYKFCPLCGAKLLVQNENLLICSNCNFHFYINPAPWNAAIIENEKGEILLTKRKYDPKKGYWDWPGGFIMPGETLEESVKREIKEELGVDVQVGKIIGAYTAIYKYQTILEPTIGIAVPAKIISGQIKPNDDITKYKYFKPEEIFKMDLAFQSIPQGIKDYLNNKR